MLVAAFWVAFLVATVPNTVEAFTDVGGTWWLVVRAVLSSIVTVVLIVLIADWVTKRLAKRRTRRSAQRSGANRPAP